MKLTDRKELDGQKTDGNTPEPLVGTSHADIVKRRPFVSALKGARNALQQTVTFKK